MIEVVGWVGAICFSICALPQAYKTWKIKHADDLSALFLWLWTIGEVCMLVYVWPRQDWPLIVNYVFNLVCLIVILYYKWRL